MCELIEFDFFFLLDLIFVNRKIYLWFYLEICIE